ncbi:kinase-like domain-containing protein [Blastocladiella britannica]|nr:kinase-like domain-containing protein [Blastocladiella britannica]
MSSASQSQYPAKSQRYSGPPTIARFEDKVMVPGGINQPKRVACIGSNGKVYKQLVKGNDDLRQDAGLMHVFSVTDALLARHAPTRQRKLGIRTYKVVPLAPQAGLLEWVDHTIPLVNVYAQQFDKRPVINGVKQLKAADARAMLGRISTQSRRSKYMMMRDQILPKFQPVFRHWFLAQPDAETWFRKRLAYSRSCAASSIIGWVVGLGDRHTSNILFDEKTAELVHIDLGISFDAGKALPIPETVPFRLTQNMVDGLGPSGLDGVFRRCCQETYRVLRAEAPVLYTILEVFKADPLHSWSDPQKLARAAHRGGDEGGSGGEPALRTSRAAAASASHGGGSGGSAASSENNEAARALRGVRRKLEARETVECKVNELIQDATSVENLAQIFCGWMPFV